jgi:hypothetical protein
MKYGAFLAMAAACGMAVPSAALAQGSATAAVPQAAAVQVASAVNAANNLPAPANPAEVNQQIPTLQPYVRAVIAKGDAAIVSLYNQTENNPAVSATLQQDLPMTGVASQTVSDPSSAANPLTAHDVSSPFVAANPLSSGCKQAQFWYKIYLGPLWVANLSLLENWWCGNGTNITYSEDALKENSTGITFCISQSQFNPLNHNSASHQSASETDKTGSGVEGACDTLGSKTWVTTINWYGNLGFTGTEN